MVKRSRHPLGSASRLSQAEGSLRSHWNLDPKICPLNHGAFGACPSAVLERQSELRSEIESGPTHFFSRRLEPLLDTAREQLAAFLGAPAEALAFVPNATSGVNAVLASLPLRAGDELVVSDGAYPACRNALEFVAARSGARILEAPLAFPAADPQALLDAVLERVGPRTRLVLIDHVTSATALVFPVAALLAALAHREIPVLIDGAHAPGSLELDLGQLAPSFYVGNAHKWLCAPKGCGFLYVDERYRSQVRPVVISHGASAPRTGRSRFHLEFDWVGTLDPTPWLCVPTALETLAGLLTGGWPAIRAHNHGLVVAARRLLCEALELAPPAPESMLASMAAFALPASPRATAEPRDPLQERLYFEHGIEVPVQTWAARGVRLLRVSAHLYNQPADFERLRDALLEERRRSGDP